MIRKCFLFFIILFLKTTILNSQINERYKIISLLNNHKLNNFNIINNKDTLKNTYNIFRNDFIYFKVGINKKTESILNNVNIDYLDSVIYYNHIGDYYYRDKAKRDQLSYKNYNIALNIAKKHKDTFLINESLRRINKYFINNDIDIINYQKAVDELLKYRINDIDKFWYKYFNAMFLLSKYKFPYNEIEKKIIEKEFRKLLQNIPNSSYCKEIIYHSLGMCYDFLDNKKLSLEYYDKALIIYNNKEYFSYSRKINTKIAKAMLGTINVTPKNEIKLLRPFINNKYVSNNIVLQHDLYNRLYKLYKEINNIDSANYFLKLQNKKGNEIQFFKTALNNNEIKINFKTKDIKDKNKNLLITNKNLKSKMNTILPILAIITLLLGVVFILYKKYYKKTEVLEEEKSETIKKIDELKQIVIKNHIILKDKTKVYIADLLYIKSDDHYLKVFLSNGKNHFVRGKLNKIVEELPPNFIRCHRSYIVNRNFIKQINNTTIILVDKTEIPLSRSYKDKL